MTATIRFADLPVGFWRFAPVAEAARAAADQMGGAFRALLQPVP